MKRHLSDEILALHAAGDLSWWAAFRARRHVGNCDICRLGLAEFSESRQALRDAGNELPPTVNWDLLSHEMHANIRVGLEASECVAPRIQPPERLGWRPAVVIASVMMVVVTGWYLSMSRLTPKPFASVESPSASIELTPAGVELRQGNHGFALLNPRANTVTYSVGAQGAQAQYVDLDTGQVTIAKVSLE
jgi:hypothetical protein